MDSRSWLGLMIRVTVMWRHIGYGYREHYALMASVFTTITSSSSANAHDYVMQEVKLRLSNIEIRTAKFRGESVGGQGRGLRLVHRCCRRHGVPKVDRIFRICVLS